MWLSIYCHQLCRPKGARVLKSGPANLKIFTRKGSGRKEVPERCKVQGSLNARQKVATDLFIWKYSQYLLIIDYFS